jgi:hypothetical protein
LLGRGLGVGSRFVGFLLGLGGLLAGGAVDRHLVEHRRGEHPLDGELADQLLWRLGCHDGGHTVGTATHICGSRKLVDAGLKGCQSCLRCVRGGHVVGVLLLGRLLCSQLVVQVELRAVHRFGGLLGLPRQFAELCHRVVGRVGQHIAGGNSR